MYCPQCFSPNPIDAEQCVKCQHDVGALRERVFKGAQFVFAQADESHPIALKVDDAMQTFRAPTIISSHQHAVGFGVVPARNQAGFGDQPRLPAPSLKLLTVVTDRKIYKPGADAAVFIVAPDAGGREAALEIKLAGQKIYEAKVPLTRDGLALHRYGDLKEGEYTVELTLPELNWQADCEFSVAEFTLSPLIATLAQHEFAHQHLTFTLKLLALSVPYTGAVEFGLQCGVCGERVVATQQATANQDGIAHGDFDLSSHGGPFKLQVTTPDGSTALVAFPGTGHREREHIRINAIGQTAEMGLLPWENAERVRGFYIGAGEVNMTPLMLDSVHAPTGTLRAASGLTRAQVVTFNPRNGASHLLERANLQRGDVIEFDVDAPYTLFTVGAFTHDMPFEGWGIVVKPIAFEAALQVPQNARPGDEIDVYLTLPSPVRAVSNGGGVGGGGGCYCWLLVYDARLEHESPVPKLAKRIYESVRDATHGLSSGPALTVSAIQEQTGKQRAERSVFLAAVMPAPDAPMAAGAIRLMRVGAASLTRELAEVKTEVEPLPMVVAPTRTEFPELAYTELFYVEGTAARSVKLGEQIGTWRVRAYVFQGADYRELTADVQAEKPLYAELDLPAMASPGDDIMASVNYFTRAPAELVISTLAGEKRVPVTGSGTERFRIVGPGRVEVRIAHEHDMDWSVREVGPPGVQKLTASRLLILDKGQSAQGERVVVYASLGQVLKDTIAALIAYPFG